MCHAVSFFLVPTPATPLSCATATYLGATVEVSMESVKKKRISVWVVPSSDGKKYSE